MNSPTTNNTTLINAEQVSKDFKSVHALRQVSLQIEAGHVYGLVGTNGAGKSTLLRTCMGLLAPTSGSVTVFGTDSRDIGDKELDRIGYVDQNMRALGWGKVKHYVEEVARAYSKFSWEKFESIRARFGFEMDRKMRTVSPGTAQQIWTTLAFCHSPELILLDEPGAAMDPLARGTMLDLCYEAAVEDGAAVVLSSHILSDIERVCDQMLMMRQGQLVNAATLDDIRERYARVLVEGDATIPGAVREIPRMGGYEAIVQREELDRWIAKITSPGYRDAMPKYREVPITFDEIFALEMAPPSAGTAREAA